MLAFSTWLHDTRNARNLNVRELARITRVDSSTISRIELRRTEATLLTAYLIGKGLHIPIEKIACDLLGEHATVPPIVSGNRGNRDVLTYQDLDNALVAFQQNREECIIWLAETLNGVERAVSGETAKTLFTPGGVSLLLEESSLYTVKLQYPPRSRWTPAHVLNIYRQGGILTFEDVRMYTTMVEEERLEIRNKRSSPDTVPHLLSAGLERVRLNQVLHLDERLQQDGLLLALCWRSMQFHFDYAARAVERDGQDEITVDRERRWIAAFALACRWVELIYAPDHLWLLPLRTKMEELATQHRASTAL